MTFYPCESRVWLRPVEEIGRQRGVVIATYVSNNGTYIVQLDEIYRDEDEEDDGYREVPPDQIESVAL